HERGAYLGRRAWHRHLCRPWRRVPPCAALCKFGTAEFEEAWAPPAKRQSRVVRVWVQGALGCAPIQWKSEEEAPRKAPEAKLALEKPSRTARGIPRLKPCGD